MDLSLKVSSLSTESNSLSPTLPGFPIPYIRYFNFFDLI
ncbi:hypothetical protein GYH30_044403 [Glycine max]|nr:hypothetical protein GYH30_044403 [Glycine max]